MKFMKTRHNTINLLAMGMLLVGLLSACTKDKINDGNNDVSNGGGRGFRAATEGDGSKTFLDRTTVKWEEGDLISVRNSTGKAKGFSLEEGANTQYGSFNSAEAGDDFYSGNYTAIYPAASTAGPANTMSSATTATFDLPAVQTYKANSFGVKAMPMMAHSTDENLEFKNVLGGVVFPLTYTHNLENCNYLVKRVVVTSNNTADVLWGTCATTISGLDGAANLSSTVANDAEDKHIITLDCGEGVRLVKDTPIDFTVMVPAGTLESGFTLTVIGDVSYKGITTTNTELYTQSVVWASGTHEGFIVRSRLSKVKTAIAMPLTGYVVNYWEYGTDNELATRKQVSDYPVGLEVTENAIVIENAQLKDDEPNSKSIRLKQDLTQNVITFYYEKIAGPQPATLIVHHFIRAKDGNHFPLCDDTTLEGLEAGTQWTTCYGYFGDEYQPECEEITLVLQEGENHVYFYYNVRLTVKGVNIDDMSGTPLYSYVDGYYKIGDEVTIHAKNLSPRYIVEGPDEITQEMSYEPCEIVFIYSENHIGKQSPKE